MVVWWDDLSIELKVAEWVSTKVVWKVDNAAATTVVLWVELISARKVCLLAAMTAA